ncbi:hypothetical protein C2S52_012555 [Perilla frutescens var. hirtella]|nr:hypothetical protein C2S52_012555 [Perilla frutescens var. hirtella]
MIDLSSNRISGSILDSIGNLNSLIYLNLSHNCITGHIPASLGSVSALESLDLSSNQLVGNIPAQLTKLTFLSRLNLSVKNLSGKIPQSGGQFPTFGNSSYSGNLALCGFPLTQKCGDDNKPPSIQILQQKRDGSDFLHGFCWQAVTLGYGYGFIFGVMVGYVIIINGKPKWLVEFFFGHQHKIIKRRRRGNVIHVGELD